MMQTLNVRLAAICVVAVALLGGGVHLLHGFQVRRQAVALRVASERAEEETHLDEAVRQLRGYVFLEPTDIPAQLRLGQLYAQKADAALKASDVAALRGNADAAFTMLEKVLRTADDSVPQDDLRKARRKAAEMALLIGRPSDAETHLAVLIKETPDDPELLLLNGRALSNRLRDDEACEQLRKAIKMAPAQIDSYLVLAEVLRRRSDRKTEADQCMLEMVSQKENVNSVRAFQEYANYLRAEGKYDEALVQAERVLKLAMEDPVGLWIAGYCCLAKGQYKTAEDYLNRGIKANKNYPPMYTALAEVKNRLGLLDQAIAVLLQGLENTKGDGYAEILWDLVNGYIDDGKFDEAEKRIKELQGLGYKPQRVDFLKGRLAVAEGKWDVGKTTLVAVLPKLLDEPGVQKQAHLYLAQCYRQEGLPDQQMSEYSAALKIDPYLSQALKGRAEIYLSRSEFPEAAEQYYQVVKGPRPDVESELALARIWIMIRLRGEKEKRDWKPVDDLLDQLEKQTSLGPPVAVFKAEVLLAKGLPQDAEALLKQCSAKFPKNVQVWMALINLAMYEAEQEADPGRKEKEWNQVSNYVDQTEKDLGDHLMVREERGSCAVRRKDPQAGAVLKKLGEGLDDAMTGPQRIQLWSSLAALSVQAGDLDLARLYERKVAEKEPTNIRIRCMLCQLDLQAYEKGRTPDLQELDQRLGEIERLGGQGPFWLYGKAIRALVQSKNTDPKLLQEAQGCLARALELRNDWGGPAVLAGKICELQNEPDQALEFYLRAIRDMKERDSDVIRRTVHLLLPHGRVEEAGELFKFLERQKSPLLGEMSQEYAYVKVFVGDIAEAEKALDKSVVPDDKNYREFFRQGQLYGVLAHRLKVKAESDKREWRSDAEMIRLGQKAVNTLLHARELEPQSDEVWFAIMRLLIEVGQPDKGQKLVPVAEASLTGEKAPITLAVCCELLSEAWKAQAKEMEAAKAAPRDVQNLRQLAASYAEKAQAKYAEGAKASPQNSRVLRQVAAFYLRSGQPEAARPLLDRIVALQSPATLSDACWARRSLAGILVNRKDFVGLCQALALIDENLRSNPTSIDDKRTKVNLLVADPRREKIGEAIQALEELLKGADAGSDDNFVLAKLYLKNNDWSSYRNRMNSVLAARKGAVQPGLLVYYVATLLDKSELDTADNWLKILEKEDKEKEQAMTPEERANVPRNFFDTVRLRAEYQFLSGELAMHQAGQTSDPDQKEKRRKEALRCYDAASNLIMAFLENPDGQPQDRGQRQLFVALAMEKFSDRLKMTGQPDLAAEFLKNADLVFGLLRNKEGGDLHFAAYLARQRRTAEFLKVLEQCADKYSADSLTVPALAMMRLKAAEPAQYDQLEKVLVAATNKSKRTVNMLLLFGELHTLRHQFDKATADYREVLAKEPRNYQALNNLGLNLARSGQDLDEALKLIDDALAISGPLAEVLDSRAVVHIVRKEYEEALQDLAAAVKDDGAAEQYFHQAWAYWLAGKNSEATAAFAAARGKGLDPKDLDPREVPVYDRLKDAL
jgi:tetratricopeptide (TPR) repeat protein